MDILYLLDRLEEAITSGSHVPFTSRSLIDDQEAQDILDQIRVAIPEELKQARRLMAERDSIIAEANEQAERIRREAEAQVSQQVSEHGLVRDAERRAEAIREEALRAAEQMRRDVDVYAYRALGRVQANLQTLLEQAERGMRALETDLAPVANGREASDEEPSEI